MSSNNIIVFPKRNINHDRIIQSVEEIEERVDLVKQYHVQSTIETVAPILFDNLSIAGFPPADDDSDIKHGAMIVESIRSFLCAQIGIPHPLQIVADKLFEYSPEEESMVISENVKIAITIKPEGKGEN